MFSVSSVCDEEDRELQYGENHPSISGLSSHDLESHSDLVSVQGHVICETDGQDGALVQPDGSNIQGSYVSLLADTASIDRTDEFTRRPLDTVLTDTIPYSVTNFSGKSSAQDLVSGGTLPTSLQTDPLISYENQNLGYGLTSQPSNMPSQCLPQFVIFQNFGSSMISPADGNNAFIHMANSVESPMITENTKELEDAVANISDNAALINPAADMLTNDQSYLVSTNNQGEIQNIQIVPGSTLNEQNNAVKVQKKSRASKVVKKKKKKLESKPKERSTEVKKFSVDELNTEGEAKTKEQLYEEYIGTTERDQIKKKTDNLKSGDNNFTETVEVDSNENVADVIHVRIEKPPEEYGQEPVEQFEQKLKKPAESYEQPNESTNELNTETMQSNKSIDGMEPIDGIDKRQLPTVGSKALEEGGRVNLNSENSPKVSLETSTNITEDNFNELGSANKAKDNLVREIKIEVERFEDGQQSKRTSERSSEKISEISYQRFSAKNDERSIQRSGEKINGKSNERPCKIRVEEEGSRKRKRQVKDDTRRQLKRKGPASLKIGKSVKQPKLDTCNYEVEGRMIEDFCRMFGTEDKCILRLKPITLKLIKPYDQLVVEIYVEDNICISSISQSSLSDGLVKHCMHFEQSASDKVEGSVTSNTRNVCTTTMVETRIIDDKLKKKRSAYNRKRKKSPKYTGLNKKKQYVVIKEENVPSDPTEVNVPLSDHRDFKLSNVLHNSLKDTSSNITSNITANITSDTISNITNVVHDITSTTTNTNVTSDITNTNITSKVTSNITSNITNTDMIAADNLNDECDNDDNVELEEGSTLKFDDSGGDTGLIDSRTLQPCVINGSKKDKNKIAAKHENMSNSLSEMPQLPKDYEVRITDEGLRMFTCPICGYSSRYPQNARKHIREHTAARDWTCEICGLGFKSNNQLQKHRAVHEPARPFTCRLCLKMFKTKGVLKQHLQRHLGLKHYVCEFCSKGFVTTGDLNKHRRSHTGDTPYQCETCLKQFSDISALHRHRKDKHRGKLFTCSVHTCGKQFTSQPALMTHLKELHLDYCIESETGFVLSDHVTQAGILDADLLTNTNIKPVNPVLLSQPSEDVLDRTEASVTIL